MVVSNNKAHRPEEAEQMRLMFMNAGFAACGFTLLAGCNGFQGDAPFSNPALNAYQAAPEPAVSCSASAILPAIIETRVIHEELTPAIIGTDGSTITPATFQTSTVQNIVRDRQEVEFDTPCREDLTPEFIASLQRALTARGYYDGEISGSLTGQTEAAIRAYQVDQGDVPSEILTLGSARALGLVALGRT